MSAERSARSVSHAEGVDKVRALQRVLYRSAKHDPTRRFHALYDKVARSDILWEAWVDVATNGGAPGVDGVSIDAIGDGGVEGVRAFLDGLAVELRAVRIGPSRCGGCTSPSRASRVSSGRSASPRSVTVWSWRRRRSSWSQSSRRTSPRSASGSDRSVRPMTPSR